MDKEHDDDLPSTVETRDEMETDDYPKTSDELEQEEDASERADDRDDDGNIGK